MNRLFQLVKQFKKLLTNRQNEHVSKLLIENKKIAKTYLMLLEKKHQNHHVQFIIRKIIT